MTTTTVSTKITKPEPEKSITNDPFFRELYIAAFGNLHAQYERMMWADFDCNLHAYFQSQKEFPNRSKFFAKVAWDSAVEAYTLFQEQATIENFNSKVTHE